MSIEVRQLSIRCQLAPSSVPAQAVPTALELQALKEQLLSQCKAWLKDQLQQDRER